MATAKEVFQKDKDLCSKWSGFVHGPEFAQVITFADAELMNQPDATMDMLKGAQRYKTILRNLVEPEPSDNDFPTPGLNHNIDPEPRTKKPTQTK